MAESKIFDYIDVNGKRQQVTLAAGGLAFTYCQVPVVYQLADENQLEVVHQNNVATKMDTLSLDEATSKQLFGRTGEVARIIVYINSTELK
mgnify:CR=1 FL=1